MDACVLKKEPLEMCLLKKCLPASRRSSAADLAMMEHRKETDRERNTQQNVCATKLHSTRTQNEALSSQFKWLSLSHTAGYSKMLKKHSTASL